MDRTDSLFFETIARQTADDLPVPFRAAAAEVVIQVEDWASAPVLRELDIDDPLSLTGLYDGVPMTLKSVSAPWSPPDIIWLFREPILHEWRARGDVTLEALIAHVTVHEFAHHFGWSDADIATIDRWWE